jgi:hypothetical protein
VTDVELGNPLTVGPCTADPGRVGLPDGRRPRLGPAPETRSEQSQRRLNARAVRRQLGPVEFADEPVLLDLIDDISGSMTGGNDALGLRHESVLIYLEHLAASRSGRRGRASRRPSWFFQCRTFDNGGSCLDLPLTEVAPTTLSRLRRALLGQTYGGSSNLGPALNASISSAQGWTGRHVRVVLSDFELFDSSVATVLESFATAPADLNLALVFRSPVPSMLDSTRIRVHHVNPDTDSPETVAMLIRDAVSAVCGPPPRARELL